MQKEKGISTLIGIIIIIAVAVVAFGGVFGYQYLTQSKEAVNINNSSKNNQTPTDQTAGWKTYKNEQYGVEFKYPANFMASKGPRGFVQIESPQESNSPAYWYIEVEKNTENLTAQQLADRNGVPNSAASPTRNKTVEIITFNGIGGVKTTMDSPPSDANPANPNYVEENTLNHTEVFVTKGNDYFVFFCINRDGLKNYNKEDFYKMLSTFKFTK